MRDKVSAKVSKYYLEFIVRFKKQVYDCKIELKNKEYSVLSGCKKRYITINNNNDLCLCHRYFNKKSMVKDEARYLIKVKNNTCKKMKNLKNNKGVKGISNIVLLLESPHRSEYKDINVYGKLVPIGPAQGGSKNDAGGGIANHLNNVIDYIINHKNISLSGNYNIIIVNPVQFQASLGSLYTGKLIGGLRNKMWKEIWEIKNQNGFNVVQDDFIRRLDNFKPCLVINACTKNLKRYVNNTINNNRNYIVVNINHPSVNWEKGHF